MTSVPYPSFVHQRPVVVVDANNRAVTAGAVTAAGAAAAALSAVGRCRVYPESCTASAAIAAVTSGGLHFMSDVAAAAAGMAADEDDDDGVDEYLAIVAKNVLQAQVDTTTTTAATTGTTGTVMSHSSDDNDADEIASTTTISTNPSLLLLLSKEGREKIKKRYMKEGVAMAQRYLRDTLLLDTSIIDVEMVVRAEDLIDTQGCLASCLLDAGCQAIVTDGTNLQAMDVCQIPRERLVAHFTLPFVGSGGEGQANSGGNGITGGGGGGGASLIHAMQAASSLAACVSVEFTKGKPFSMEAINQITQFALAQDLLNQQQSHHNKHGDDDDGDDTDGSTTTSDDQQQQQYQKVQVVLQFRPQDCVGGDSNSHNNHNKNMSDEEMAQLVGLLCRKLKNGLGTVTLVDPTARQMGLAYAACLVTDRKDQLYTTVVCTRNGEALGLVYSSKDSIVAALESGRGVYYSRSRKGLWRKGDTSGHYQTLHRLDIDCDGDALRFTVTQRGGGGGRSHGNHHHHAGGTTANPPAAPAAFCHLNTLTCWGPPHGLRHLEETLQQRLHDAPPGSYTQRLFQDDDLLRNKLVEEAQELAEAQEPSDVASELADVLYFAMVRAAKAGVSIDDAVQELDLRSRKVTRRQGDSKVFRIEAGKAILMQQQQQQQQQQREEEEEEEEEEMERKK